MQPPSTLQRSAVLAACADMIRACGLTLAELAQQLGQPLQAAPIALPPGERSDLTNRPRLQATLQLADNPDGISVPEIQALWGVGHQTKVAGSKKAPAPMGARTPHKPVPTAKQNVTFCPPKPPEQIKPKGEPVRTEKTIETRDTTVRPAAKWQMQQLPPDPRFPSFASVRPGVNPDTGMAWDGRA